MNNAVTRSEISSINSTDNHMKFQTLPVRRRPVSKGIFHRLSAVTRKRQRVSASATMAGMDMDDGGAKISRNLMIIFMIHIVAIALIFIHQRFLEDRPQEGNRSVSRDVAAPVAAAKLAAVAEPGTLVKPKVAFVEKSNKTHITKDGETYATIAASLGVAEGDLRQLNQNITMRKGLILQVPAINAAAVAVPAVTVDPSLAAPTDAPAAPTSHAATDVGMVEAVPVDVSRAPKAKTVVESNLAPAATDEKIKSSGKTHLVKRGDTIVRIAKQYKVTQEALMSANSITDPTKLKAGANLVIP